MAAAAAALPMHQSPYHRGFGGASSSTVYESLPCEVDGAIRAVEAGTAMDDTAGDLQSLMLDGGGGSITGTSTYTVFGDYSRPPALTDDPQELHQYVSAGESWATPESEDDGEWERMGVISELGRQWKSRGSTVVIWDPLKCGQDVIEFNVSDDEDDSVTALCITAWRDTTTTGGSLNGTVQHGRRQHSRRWMMAVATVTSVYLLVLSVSDTSQSLQPPVRYASAPLPGEAAEGETTRFISMCGTPGGAIYAGASDGSIWEVEYVTETELWREQQAQKARRRRLLPAALSGSGGSGFTDQHRAKLKCLHRPFSSHLPGIFRSMASRIVSISGPVVQVAFDESRSLLYALGSSSEADGGGGRDITVLRIDPEGKGPVRHVADILHSSILTALRNMGTAAYGGSRVARARAFFSSARRNNAADVIALFPVPFGKGGDVCLLAILRGGTRVYVRVWGYESSHHYSAAQRRQIDPSKRVPSKLVVGLVRPPDRSPVVSVRSCAMTESGSVTMLDGCGTVVVITPDYSALARRCAGGAGAIGAMLEGYTVIDGGGAGLSHVFTRATMDKADPNMPNELCKQSQSDDTAEAVLLVGGSSFCRLQMVRPIDRLFRILAAQNVHLLRDFVTRYTAVETAALIWQLLATHNLKAGASRGLARRDMNSGPGPGDIYAALTGGGRSGPASGSPRGSFIGMTSGDLSGMQGSLEASGVSSLGGAGGAGDSLFLDGEDTAEDRGSWMAHKAACISAAEQSLFSPDIASKLGFVDPFGSSANMNDTAAFGGNLALGAGGGAPQRTAIGSISQNVRMATSAGTAVVDSSLSPRLRGLCLYISRLVRPFWKTPLMSLQEVPVSGGTKRRRQDEEGHSGDMQTVLRPVLSLRQRQVAKHTLTGISRLLEQYSTGLSDSGEVPCVTQLITLMQVGSQGLELLQLLGEGGGSRRPDASAELRKQQSDTLMSMRDMYFNTTLANPEVCRPLVASLIQLGLLSEGTARRRFPALVPPMRNDARLTGMTHGSLTDGRGVRAEPDTMNLTPAATSQQRFNANWENMPTAADRYVQWTGVNPPATRTQVLGRQSKGANSLDLWLNKSAQHPGASYSSSSASR
ncbi:hypothetical protein FOL47_000042 [Perkinsus chesapeaki]|uniref:Nucleoporin Nup133/Nup155-like N-terminal domain-containing protein n=1 Tax=Perkinsus chesapeaki TaxID=330153 RepID=A0A7J6N366_PERCH|nr:hypothetical protein FOL47_000042 [Perkinsus chesapeaki]